MTTWSPEYSARGIEPDTFACIAVLTAKEAQRIVWLAAQLDIPVRVHPHTSGQHWHVAVPGGAAGQPALYFSMLRDGPINPPEPCIGSLPDGGQHPLRTTV